MPHRPEIQLLHSIDFEVDHQSLSNFPQRFVCNFVSKVMRSSDIEFRVIGLSNIIYERSYVLCLVVVWSGEEDAEPALVCGSGLFGVIDLHPAY